MCGAPPRRPGQGRLDRVEPPVAPLDVLAQQIAAECSTRDWSEDALYALVREAAPYAKLDRGDFDAVVTSLTEGAAPRTGRGSALLHHDRVHGLLKGRRATRLVATMNGGAIPDLADYRVVLDPDETLVGTVNEDWAIESMAGDVFVLGSHSWRIRRVESRRGVVRVEDAQGQAPNVPFWLGEAPSRSWELSGEVSRLRADLVAAIDSGEDMRQWLAAECVLGPIATAQLSDYVSAQRDALGVVPTMEDVVFERFFDESGGMQLVVHAPFGGRVNRAFGLALRKRFCVSFDFELQAAATDDAIVLSMGMAHSFPLTDAFHFVRSTQLDATLQQAILQAPMFGTRWRWNASRALAVRTRDRGGKVPAFLQRMRADDLLAAVFPAQVACQDNAGGGPIEVPDHPLVKQTLLDCLHEAMDVERLRDVVERIERGAIRVHARDTTEPSPFSHEVLNAKPYAFLDDAPLEERRARAVSLRRTLPEHQRDLGALDPTAIARVVAEAAPSPRDADELHDALLGLVAAPILEPWSALFDELARSGRAARMGDLGFCLEKTRTVEAIYVGAARRTVPPHLDGPVPPRDDALLSLVRGHAEIAGPFTTGGLAERLGLDPLDVEGAVGQLEGEGLVLRGRFTPGGTETEVCDRRLLARIHRHTLDRLRSEIEPVSAQDFMRSLLERHRLTARARAGGRAALREAIAALQGFEVAAAAWELEVLAPRVAGYRPEWLDELCLAGEVSWARLSPRPSGARALGSTSRATPITLALRKDMAWLLEAVRGAESPEDPPPGPSREALAVLRARGALFIDDVAAAASLDRHDLTDALWDLVGRGLVTGDGFAPLREILSHGKAGRRKRAQGRWSLVERRDASEDLADRVAQQLLARVRRRVPRGGDTRELHGPVARRRARAPAARGPRRDPRRPRRLGLRGRAVREARGGRVAPPYPQPGADG